ncbi:MAG: sulfatase-like hydrolase/transferase [Mariniblastus sp.]|nr:sulfatase-like hydrolase/transferase [Mariniblastus sp.]
MGKNSCILFGVLLVFLTALTQQVSAQAEKTTKLRQPHMVLFLADDLGWGDVGYHGSQIKTPHIDALAEAGTRLNRFYVMPVCSPTRGALMTGRYPVHLGLQCGVVRPWAEHGLPTDERTLPQALQEVGYKTAIVGKWHLGHNDPSFLPTNRGFDHQYGHYNGALDYFTHIRDGGHDWHRNDRRNDDPGYTTELIAREATRVIEQHDPSKPLFLYVPFNAPHSPIQAPEKYIQRYSEIKNPKRRVFAAMVDCMDDAIGQIMEQLKASGFAPENTLVIFASDNGGIVQFGSVGPWRGQKGKLYEGGVRSPTIVVWKGQLKPGSQVNEPMHIVDLYPTLLRLAGADLKQAKPLDGHDAWPTISTGKPSPHTSILLNSTPFTGAVLEGNWKLIWNGQVRANQTELPKNELWELYDLANDPTESNNLYAKQPEIASRLKKVVQDYRNKAAKPNIPPNRTPKDFNTPAVWGEFR